MIKITKLLLLTACCVVMFSCEKATVEFDDKGVTKISTPLPKSFEKDVLPLFKKSCSGSACHSETNTNRTFRLYTVPSDAYLSLIAASDNDTKGTSKIAPGDVAASTFLQNRYTSTPGKHRGLVMLQTDVDIVAAWIAEGAKNN